MKAHNLIVAGKPSKLFTFNALPYQQRMHVLSRVAAMHVKRMNENNDPLRIV